MFRPGIVDWLAALEAPPLLLPPLWLFSQTLRLLPFFLVPAAIFLILLSGMIDVYQVDKKLDNSHGSEEACGWEKTWQEEIIYTGSSIGTCGYLW